MLKTHNLYLVYWTIACVLVGVLVAPVFYTVNPEDHSTHLNHNHNMAHGTVEVNPNSIPTVAIRVEKDADAGWNLFVETSNFTFTPENANQANIANQGHAHIYIDGEKLTRLYGTSYHLSDLSLGKHAVSVSLNANDHSGYVLNGKPIMATVEIEQKPKI